MKYTTMTGTTIDYPVGAALCGYHFRAITITHADLKQAGGQDELLRYLAHNCLVRLQPMPSPITNTYAVGDVVRVPGHVGAPYNGGGGRYSTDAVKRKRYTGEITEVAGEMVRIKFATKGRSLPRVRGCHFSHCELITPFQTRTDLKKA